jgi:hypothetical protein
MAVSLGLMAAQAPDTITLIVITLLPAMVTIMVASIVVAVSGRPDVDPANPTIEQARETANAQPEANGVGKATTPNGEKVPS